MFRLWFCILIFYFILFYFFFLCMKILFLHSAFFDWSFWWTHIVISLQYELSPCVKCTILLFFKGSTLISYFRARVTHLNLSKSLSNPSILFTFLLINILIYDNSLLVPKFAGSNPAEAVGFLGRKNPQHAFLRRGSKAVGPMS